MKYKVGQQVICIKSNGFTIVGDVYEVIKARHTSYQLRNLSREELPNWWAHVSELRINSKVYVDDKGERHIC